MLNTLSVTSLYERIVLEVNFVILYAEIGRKEKRMTIEAKLESGRENKMTNFTGLD